jgi:quinol monooxygenase YgiN
MLYSINRSDYYGFAQPANPASHLLGGLVLIVVGSARARAGHREDLASAAREMAAAAREDDGCQAYGFYADLADENTILSLEIWRDQEALDAHTTHPHTQQFLNRTTGLMEGTPTMAFHEVRDAR